MSAAQISTAMESVANYYMTLPHQNMQTDLANAAAFAQTQAGIAGATANPGGISATLENGALAYFFADKGIYVTNSSGSSANTIIQGGSPHEIAFLEYDYADPAFVPSRQQHFAAAFPGAGYPTSMYRSEEGSASLDNIAALHNGGVDFLDISTHGGIYRKPAGAQYVWLSTTPVTAANMQKWSADLAAGNLYYGLQLYPSGYVPLATFAFTPGFVTSHVTFNSGAIVDNVSCFGENPLIASAVQNTLFAANVGIYYGWTKSVVGADSDDTDAFLLDRTLGEQNPSASGLATYVTQRNPVQRPFALFETYYGMSQELRLDPLDGSTVDTYVDSTPTNAQASAENMLFPPLADGAVAHFIEVPSPSLAPGAPIPANGIIEYGRPSIEYVYTDETTSPATLKIIGEFPANEGEAGISSSPLGTSPASISITNWSQTEIDATIPDDGATSSGYAVVTEAGVASNAVPLTKWAGTLQVAQTIDIGGGTFRQGASGSETVDATFNFNFRADVHPVVNTVDTAPVPNSFAVATEKDGTGSFTAVSGTYSTGTGGTIQFGLGPSVTMVTYPPGSNSFSLTPSTSGTNSAQYGCSATDSGGPYTGADVDIQCLQFNAGAVGVIKVSCSDTDQGSTCAAYGVNPNPLDGDGGFGTACVGANAIEFILNPDYSVSAQTNVPSPDGCPPLNEPLGSELGNAITESTNYAFSFSDPANPPIAGTTPSSRVRRFR